MTLSLATVKTLLTRALALGVALVALATLVSLAFPARVRAFAAATPVATFPVSPPGYAGVIASLTSVATRPGDALTLTVEVVRSNAPALAGTQLRGIAASVRCMGGSLPTAALLPGDALTFSYPLRTRAVPALDATVWLSQVQCADRRLQASSARRPLALLHPAPLAPAPRSLTGRERAEAPSLPRGAALRHRTITR